MKQDRRRFTRRSFISSAAAGALGAGLAWRFGGSLSLAQIPWEDKVDSVLLGEDTQPGVSALNRLGSGIKNEAPRIAFDRQGRLWVAWISERDDGEQVYLTSFAGEKWGEEIRLSESGGFASHPQVVATGDGLAVAWAEKQGEQWKILFRRVNHGRPGPIQIVSTAGAINWRPALSVDSEDRVWIAWECKQGERFEILAAVVQGERPSKPFPVSRSPKRDCCRPAVVTDKKGTTWIAWDRMDAPGGPNIYLCPCEPGAPGKPVQVTHHPAANIAPALAIDPDNRLWIAWHSNRRGAAEWDIPRWIYLRCYDRGRFHEPVGEPLGKNLEKEGQDQSFEFARLLCSGDGKVIVTGRPSHNFCFQYYQGRRWSPRYRLPVDGWGGRGQFLEAAFDSEGDLWVVRRDIRTNVLQRVTGLQSEKARPKLNEVKSAPAYHPPLANIQRRPRRWEPLKDLAGVEGELNFFYGDIHGHTWMSDGVGDVDEYYFTRRDYYEDDFAALTDHDTFVGNGLLPSEWELMKAITEHFNAEGRFITLFGQEWTTGRPPRGFGHKNIYHIRGDLPLFDHMDGPSSSTQKLFARCKEWGAIAIPHHIGWTGVDWENHDENVQALVEVISNHGRFEFMGNRPIPHRGGIRGCFMQDGLARGLKFGVIGGSDSHGLIWHHRVAYKRDCNRTGLAVVLAPELTREALFDAMRKRRTFATTGIKPRIDFRIDDHVMGAEFETAEPPTIRVKVSGQNDLKWLTVVKNNQDWYEFGGEGFESRFTIKDEKAEPGQSFYYLRVEYEDGNMAWTSPIWVKYTG